MLKWNIILCGIILLLLSSSSLAAEKKLPEVVVKDHNGRPTVFIDGVPNALPGYFTLRRKAFEEDVPQFFEHDMGVYYIEPPVVSWEGDVIQPLTEQNKSRNMISLDEMAQVIMDGDPDAWIIVRFMPRAPTAWRNAHPQEYFMTDDNTISYVPTPSIASDVFWDKMAEVSAGIISYVESRPWASRVIGYANFNVTEGTHAPLHQSWLFDHNPLMLTAFRDHLRKKYGSDEKLREAYGDPTISINTMTIPFDRLNGSVPDVSQLPYWQDSKENTELRDYLELQMFFWHKRFRQISDAMHNAVDREVLLVHDCLKQTMQGWNNWGFFKYGKVRELYSWPMAYPETMSGSGHMNIAPLFDVPGFDGLITPHDYHARGIGGVYEPEGIVDSVILRGKYFMSEMDTRTYMMPANGIGQAADDREWAAITWRNMATGFTRGFNSYWMEFGGGWFHSDGIHDVIHRQVEVMNESLDFEHETMPGIAMIIDDTSVLETNGNGSFLNEAVMWEWKLGMARCGVPHNIYLFEDLELDNFPKHRVYYFPNLFQVSEEKMRVLREKVFRDGVVVVFGPGSGISDGEKIGTESATALTGFDFEMIPSNCWRRILVSHNGHPLTADIPEDTIIGSPLSYGPILIPTDGEMLGMAWTKGGHRHSGLVIKEFGKGAARNIEGIASRGANDYAAIFSVAVPLPADLWRNIAKYAGAHVYTESNDVILADKSVVALHSIYSGRKTINLPGVYRVRDLVTNMVYSENTENITFDMTAPETKIFLIEE